MLLVLSGEDEAPHSTILKTLSSHYYGASTICIQEFREIGGILTKVDMFVEEATEEDWDDDDRDWHMQRDS